eukprot:4766168-Pleurochrysis_carterae.AAC.2
MHDANGSIPGVQRVCMARGNLLPVDRKVAKGVTNALSVKNRKGQPKMSLEGNAHVLGGDAPIGACRGGVQEVASVGLRSGKEACGPVAHGDRQRRHGQRCVDVQPTQVTSYCREAPLAAGVAVRGPHQGQAWWLRGVGARRSGSGRPEGRKGVWSWPQESVNTAVWEAWRC